MYVPLYMYIQVNCVLNFLFCSKVGILNISPHSSGLKVSWIPISQNVQDYGVLNISQNVQDCGDLRITLNVQDYGDLSITRPWMLF